MTFTDDNVSPAMNIFLVFANIINIIYNVPQVVKTYQTKSTKDFSGWFIFMRIIGNSIWFAYSIEINNSQMIINNTITVLSSIFIGYYKGMEIMKNRRAERLDAENTDLSYADIIEGNMLERNLLENTYYVSDY
jgi:uncharacterized protein with PQ loop repeat